MKKLTQILFIFSVFLFACKPFYAQTIDGVQAEQNRLKKQQDEALKELQSQNYTYDSILAKMNELLEEEKNLNTQKAQIQTDITNKEAEIQKTEEEKNKLVDQAGSVLAFYQEVDGSNPMLEQIFNNEGVGSKSYENAMISNQIVDSGMDYIDQAIQIGIKLNKEKTELESKKTELSTKETEVNNAIAKQKALKETEFAKKMQAQKAYDDAASQKKASDALAKKMQEAGCKPGEVYGVSCGITIQSAGTFLRPTTKGEVTAEFNDPTYTALIGRSHVAIDIANGGAATSNLPIYAVAPGQVIVSGFEPVQGSGEHVQIVHIVNGETIVSSYSHMQRGSLRVSEGQMVDANTQLGIMGATGNVTGPHLHLAISKGAYGYNGGQFVDPRRYIQFPPKGVKFNSR